MLSIPSILVILTTSLFIGCYAPRPAHSSGPAEENEAKLMIEALMEEAEKEAKSPPKAAKTAEHIARETKKVEEELKEIEDVIKTIKSHLCENEIPNSDKPSGLHPHRHTTDCETLEKPLAGEEAESSFKKAVKAKFQLDESHLSIVESILNNSVFHKSLHIIKSVVWSVSGRVHKLTQAAVAEAEKGGIPKTEYLDPTIAHANKEHEHMSKLNNLHGRWFDNKEQWREAITGLIHLAKHLKANSAHISKHDPKTHPHHPEHHGEGVDIQTGGDVNADPFGGSGNFGGAPGGAANPGLPPPEGQQSPPDGPGDNQGGNGDEGRD